MAARDITGGEFALWSDNGYQDFDLRDLGDLGTIAIRAAWLSYTMPDKDPTSEADAGKQIQPRPHDTGSQANETTDGLDSTTEALRRAAEDTPSGATPEDVEATPLAEPSV